MLVEKKIDLWYNNIILRRNISNPYGLLDTFAEQGIQIVFVRLFVCKHPTALQTRFVFFSPLLWQLVSRPDGRPVTGEESPGFVEQSAG